MIQTEFPGHPLYHALCRHDYESLARTLLAERKLARFPPFIYQVLLWAEAPKIDLALAFLAEAAALAEAPKDIEIFDPVPAQMARLKGMERAYLLVQSGSRNKLQKFLGEWRGQLDAFLAAKYAGHWTWIRWSFNLSHSPVIRKYCRKTCSAWTRKPHALMPSCPHTLQAVSASNLPIICSA